MIFFWSVKDKYGMFSNFYPCVFTDEDGLVYNCSEQYFMVQKLKTFDKNNRVLLDKMLCETDPKKIRQLGRQVRNYDEQQWDLIRYSVMLQGLTYKFTQNPDLQKILLGTGEQMLAEASPYDQVWGIGMFASDAKAQHPSQWRGQNLLGKALMKLRDHLKTNTSKETQIFS